MTDGLFTVQVDFGVGPFTGQPVWLEIQVRPAGSGLFTELPRQQLTATPYALYSSNADFADNADFFDGLNSSDFLRITGGAMTGNIVFNDTLGIRSQSGASIETGNNGNTFHFRASPFPGAAIASFWDSTGAPKLMVDEAGLLRFLGGQKMCRIYPHGLNPWNSTILVPGGWTPATCAAYRNSILGSGNGNYQLWCLFDTGYSVGPPNGGSPSPNCGW